MIFVMISSSTARRPLAPILRSMARWAIASSAAIFEIQRHMIQLQQLAILPAERIFRLGQDAHQILLRQAVEAGDHRHTADQLRDQAELQQIVRLHLREQRADVALLLALQLRSRSRGSSGRHGAR